MITKLYHNNGKNNHIRITYYMKNHKEDGGIAIIEHHWIGVQSGI
ncbi:hypothetical protein P9F83_13350 [Peribacillus psychrosaccharolyticus]|nr:hypothetical protein [Peribacillus psychrosaccharolyticus]MEC2056205.1 hypothetical protein [Peribacillus psychrosaccharolyticus]